MPVATLGLAKERREWGAMSLVHKSFLWFFAIIAAIKQIFFAVTFGLRNLLLEEVLSPLRFGL